MIIDDRWLNVKRFIAGLIDYGLYLVIFVIFIRYFGAYYENPDGTWGYTATGLPALIAYFFWFLCFPIMEAAVGFTIGKRILDLKVIRDNQKPRFRFALLRHLFDLIDMGVLMLGILFPFIKKKAFRRIGDMVANTYVVSDKGKAGYSDSIN